MNARDTYPELVRMIRRLYEELMAHDLDYHHRTNRRVLVDAREFLVAVGELPAPPPVVVEAPEPAEPGKTAEAERETKGAGA